jgi:hypothetical protein
VNYTRTGNKITFVAGEITATGVEVKISSSVSPLAGTDATTFAGHALSEFALKVSAGGLQLVADTTAAAALTGLTTDALVFIPSLGLYRYSSTATDTADGESVLTVTAGGRLFMELANIDFVMAYVDPLIEEVRPNTVLVSVATQSLTAGLSYTLAVSVPGARANDCTVVGPPMDLPTAITYKAVVTGADTITLTISNPSGGTVAVPGNIWRVGVMNS